MRKVLYLMGVLNDEDVEWLSKIGTIKFLPEGTILIREGKRIDEIFIVLDGKLSVLIQTAGNREIAKLLAGEIVGEISFVDLRPPSASVVAVQDSHVLVVSRAVLRGRLVSDAAFSARFYEALATLLADRLRSTEAFLGDNKRSHPIDLDELDATVIESASMAARRFDRLLRRLRIN